MKTETYLKIFMVMYFIIMALCVYAIFTGYAVAALLAGGWVEFLRRATFN